MCETALSLSVVQVRLSDAQPSVDRSHTLTHDLPDLRRSLTQAYNLPLPVCATTEYCHCVLTLAAAQ